MESLHFAACVKGHMNETSKIQLNTYHIRQ